jgi:hypothetical protein
VLIIVVFLLVTEAWISTYASLCVHVAYAIKISISFAALSSLSHELDPSLVGILSTQARLLERLCLYLKRVHILPRQAPRIFILHLVLHAEIKYLERWI